MLEQSVYIFFLTYSSNLSFFLQGKQVLVAAATKPLKLSLSFSDYVLNVVFKRRPE